MKILKGFGVAATMVAASLGMSTPANAIPVALELQLLVDVSGSVDAGEFNLQKGGYVAAFQDPVIQAAIAALAGSGGIAVQYISWSGTNQQSVQVGWTQITDAASANAFAAAINATVRPFSGNTAPGSAINFGTPLFLNNGFEGTRLVMDVSGDGAQNEGASTPAARNAAVAAGITINGLPILGEAGLAAWYAANIVSVGGFQVNAVDFAAFTNAVKTKIGREITQTPEPGTLALFSLGLLGIGLMRRKA